MTFPNQQNDVQWHCHHLASIWHRRDEEHCRNPCQSCIEASTRGGRLDLMDPNVPFCAQILPLPLLYLSLFKGRAINRKFKMILFNGSAYLRVPPFNKPLISIDTSPLFCLWTTCTRAQAALGAEETSLCFFIYLLLSGVPYDQREPGKYSQM